MNKLLILGSSGFLGRNLILLASRSLGTTWQLYGADFQTEITNRDHLVDFFILDATEKGAVTRLIATLLPDYIINLIGTFSVSQYEEFMKINVNCTKNILDACIELSHAPKKILIIGSAAEYGIPNSNPLKEISATRPVGLYGLSKLIQTQLALYYFDAKGLPVVIARTFNITGTGLSTALSIGSFSRQIDLARNGDSIYVGNIETERDFLPVEEVVKQYLDILEYGVTGCVYNVCSGRPIKIRVILDEMIRKSEKTLKIEVDSSRLQQNDVPCIYGDPSRYLDLIRKSNLSLT